MTDPDRPDDLSDVADVEALLREIEPEDLERGAPPTDVWAGIESQLRDDVVRLGGRDARSADVSSTGRRRTRQRILAVAAASVLIVGGLATYLLTRNGGTDEVRATAVLIWDANSFDPLGDGATADAQLIEHDGGYEIRLVDAQLPEQLGEQADLELWMISLDADGKPADIAPVSLVDASDPGTYPVPETIDPTTHFVIDISIEPRDGDARHSGRSILRGPLTYR